MHIQTSSPQVHTCLSTFKKGIILATYTSYLLILARWLNDYFSDLNAYIKTGWRYECIYLRLGEDLPASRLFFKMCLITSLLLLPKHLQTISSLSTGINQRSSKALCKLLTQCNSAAIEQKHYAQYSLIQSWTCVTQTSNRKNAFWPFCNKYCIQEETR